MVSPNLVDLSGSSGSTGPFQRYATERRLVAEHPLTDAVLRHGGRTLQAIARLRLIGASSAATAAAFDDLESLTYRLAAKAHRAAAAVLRLRIAPDDDEAWQDVRATSAIARLLLTDMCQAWTAIFLETPLDGTLMDDLRRGFADVESHLAALTKRPGSAAALPGR